MSERKAKLVALAESLEQRAREIEGDSDSPLRVAAANTYWDRAAEVRLTLAAKEQHP